MRPGGRPLAYGVVSAVRDEAQYLSTTARSLIAQTRPPAHWVIVDDGSRDDTGSLAERYAREHDWITVVRRPRRTRRGRGAPVVAAFDHGRRALRGDHDVVVKLDGDLHLPAHYFEWVLDVFEAEPTAGIVGGTLLVHHGGRWVPDRVGRRTVHGAVKAYRRACLEAIGGLQPSMGWDGIDEYAARARGWSVVPLSELCVLHYRLRGSKQSWARARFEEGVGARYMGYTLRGIAVRVAYRSFVERPLLIGGAAMAAGFAWATLTRQDPCPDGDAVALLRSEQRRRFRRLVTRGRDLPPPVLRRGGPAFWALRPPPAPAPARRASAG